MNCETANPVAKIPAQDDRAGTFNWFVLSAGVILAITGLAKVWTAFGDVKLLTVNDPIFGVPFGNLMLAAGLAEMAIAWLCFFDKRPVLAIILVAWLATSFLLYRLGLSWLDWKRPCGCLGNLTDVFNISPQAVDNFMKAVLAYLIIGSYGLLIRQLRAKLDRATI